MNFRSLRNVTTTIPYVTMPILTVHYPIAPIPPTPTVVMQAKGGCQIKIKNDATIIELRYVT